MRILFCYNVCCFLYLFLCFNVFLGREVTIPDVNFEQACILYNIGALNSILGSIETRQSADVSMCVPHTASHYMLT
jgi:hypothetical protein